MGDVKFSEARSPVFALLLALTVLPLCAGSKAFAADDLQAESSQAKLTIMFYACGTNLETDAGMASYNLRQILAANFSADNDVRFIVMTDGAEKWRLESSFVLLHFLALGQHGFYRPDNRRQH